jgi:hypothetical protein
MNKAFAAPLFLRRLKPLLEADKLEFKPRNWRKTMEFMIAEDLHEEDIYSIIAQLTPDHYHNGPEEDEDGSPGNVMVFFCPYKRTQLYIKLKIWADINGDAGIVMSFHEEGTYD